jgi:hypothetical protein
LTNYSTGVIFTTVQTTKNAAMIAPGKYYAFASPTPFDRSPETVTAILRGRQKAKEVQVAPSDRQNIELTVEQ